VRADPIEIYNRFPHWSLPIYGFSGNGVASKHFQTVFARARQTVVVRAENHVAGAAPPPDLSALGSNGFIEFTTPSAGSPCGTL